MSKLFNVHVTNNNVYDSKFVLFGNNQYSLHTNFGSADGVEILTDSTYAQTIHKSAFEPFKLKKIVLTARYCQQLYKPITYITNAANGQKLIKVIKVDYTKIRKTKAGLYTYTIWGKNNVYALIDGCSQIHSTILKNSWLTFAIHKKTAVHLGRGLFNVDYIEKLRTTRSSNNQFKYEGEPAQNPYCTLHVKNETDKPKKACLFGYYKHLQTTNFGSETGISIVPDKNEISYMQILTQTACQPFILHSIKIDLNESNNIITRVVDDCEGTVIEYPVIPQNYLQPDGESTKVTVPILAKLDGETHFELYIPAHKIVTLSFIPMVIEKSTPLTLGNFNEFTTTEQFINTDALVEITTPLKKPTTGGININQHCKKQLDGLKQLPPFEFNRTRV